MLSIGQEIISDIFNEITDLIIYSYNNCLKYKNPLCHRIKKTSNVMKELVAPFKQLLFYYYLVCSGVDIIRKFWQLPVCNVIYLRKRTNESTIISLVWTSS